MMIPISGPDTSPSPLKPAEMSAHYSRMRNGCNHAETPRAAAGSSDDIGVKLILDAGDLILQMQLLPLQVVRVPKTRAHLHLMPSLRKATLLKLPSKRMLSMQILRSLRRKKASSQTPSQQISLSYIS